jgi:hypothetical protein
VSKRNTSNPNTRPANSCVVEYIGQHFAGKGTMSDLHLSGDGTKTLATSICVTFPFIWGTSFRSNQLRGNPLLLRVERHTRRAL